jgi:hypothetical protein
MLSGHGSTELHNSTEIQFCHCCTECVHSKAVCHGSSRSAGWRLAGVLSRGHPPQLSCIHVAIWRIKTNHVQEESRQCQFQDALSWVQTRAAGNTARSLSWCSTPAGWGGDGRGAPRTTFQHLPEKLDCTVFVVGLTASCRGEQMLCNRWPDETIAWRETEFARKKLLIAVRYSWWLNKHIAASEF